MKIGISADSTCDLPLAYAKDHGITVLPLYVIKEDGSSYRDGVDISTPDVFAYTEATGKITGTSAVTVGDYIETWTEMKKEYDVIIHVAFSSELSACCSNARIAAAEFENIRVVDSRNLTTGYGHLALDAVEMVKNGLTPDEIVAELERKIPCVESSFMLDTLEYMRRGGRCTTVQALGANMLKLKPCIEVHDGKMHVAKKYRGRIERAYLQYVRDRLAGRSDLDLRRIFITDSGIPEDMYESVRAAILSYQPFEEVIRTSTGCTVSSHCGPMTMGILYMRKPEN